MSRKPTKILHVDMDAFYASVEQRDDARLRGKPIAVGGPRGRGVIASASYEARRFGVRSAMNSSQALRLCPELIVVEANMARYLAESARIRAIFDRASEVVEPLSLDEAFLDVSENLLGLETATEVAQWIRAAIREELRLTASAGVAPLKFVAKIASDFRKPDGLTVVKPHHVLDFIRPLPIEKLWGVGPSTASALHALGIHTVAELADAPAAQVLGRLGSRGQHLMQLARGVDPRRVTAERIRKSFGAERTFDADVLELDRLRSTLAVQSEGLGRGHRPAARTITLKLRYDDFETITRSATLEQATDDPARWLEEAIALLSRTEAGSRPVRLIGMSLSNLAGTRIPSQLDLPFEPDPAD